MPLHLTDSFANLLGLDLLGFLYGRSHDAAPLGPGTVIVAYVLVSQQLGQNEPCVGGTLTDTAIGDGFFGAVDSFASVERRQVVCGFERTVFVDCLAPRDVGRPRDMSAPL